MGMDVIGKNPTTDQGEYFRANVWYWHPLWSMVEYLYPNIAAKVKHAHSNDGDGLSQKDSIILSQLLKKDLESGDIQSFIDDFEESKNSLEKHDCTYCSQTGYRAWPQPDGSLLQKICNVCNGTLKVDDFMSSYYMNIDLIKEFQVFLENCGGFEIW